MVFRGTDQEGTVPSRYSQVGQGSQTGRQKLEAPAKEVRLGWTMQGARWWWCPLVEFEH